METRTCVKCGYALFESGRFCPQCGAAQEKVCSSCGALNSPDAKFCSQCGENFGTYKHRKSASAKKTIPSKRTDKKKWMIALAGVAVCAAAVWYVALSDKSAGRATESAGGATIDPNMQQTLVRLQTQLKQNPENVQTWIQLGDVYYDTGNFHESIFYYQHALMMDSTNNNVRVDMAIGYYNTGHPERAVEEMKKTLARDPNHLNALFNIGVVLNSMGDREGARGYWNQYLALQPAGELSRRIRSMIEEWK